MKGLFFLLLQLSRWLPLIAVVLVIYFGSRRAGLFRYHRWSSATPARTARLAEATMIFGLSLMILLVLTVQPFTGKPVLSEHYIISESFAWTAAAATLMICAAAAVPALFGHALLAVLLTTAALMNYVCVVRFPTKFLQLQPRKQSSSVQPDTFTLVTAVNGISFPAELWLNGVYVGKTPATLSRRQIKDIPVWDKPPAELDPPELWLKWYSRSPYLCHTSEHRKSAWNEPRIYDLDDKKWCTYFARVRYGDKWLYSSGGGGSGDQYTLDMELPDKQLWPGERLLDQARANDYCVNSDWLAAFDTLETTGWQRLARVVEHEPEFAPIVDRLTAWKYGIDRVRTPEDAWTLFERICREANKTGQYYTNTMAGRAVELLTPKLDPEKLISHAEDLIATQQGLAYSYSLPANGKVRFGFSRPGNRRLTPAMPGLAATRYNDFRGDVDITLYAVAHAIWTLDQQLDAIDDQTPNLVEQRIPHALLTWHFLNEDALLIANALGGCPEIDRYLLRQDWQISGTDFQREWKHQLHGHGSSPVNKWLFLLANLNSSAGFAFRQQHRREIMEMADTWLKDGFDNSKLPDFLFMDLDLGTKSFAAEYWPHLFSVLRDHQRLETQFVYLVRMEPVSTTDMYVQAWRQHTGDEWSFRSAIEKLKPLPLARQREVVTALRSELRQRVDNVNSRSKDESRGLLLQLLDDRLHGDRRYSAEEIMNHWAGPLAPEMRKAIPEWLTFDEPDHPVVALLADSADADLRILVMGALRNHPSPAHRVILDRLLADPNPQVQAAAEQVRANLDQLIATPPQDLLRIPQSQPAP